VESFLGFANFYWHFIIPKDIWKIEEQDYKSTSTHSTKERKKIQSRDQCFRTCNWRSLISKTRREIKTHCIFIKNNASSWNYEIYNKDLLATVEALTKWRQYLLDVMEKFEVWTDHKNLKYFWELYKLNE